MAIFENVSLEWRGEKYVVPANRMLGAIAAMEQHIGFFELADPSQLRKLSLARLARAFASVLRYAGCAVSDDEVYADLFASKTTVTQQVIPAINTLLLLMMPPDAVPKVQAKGAPRGNPSAASRPSKRSIRQRSVSAAG
jgi:hypothetical protein